MRAVINHHDLVQRYIDLGYDGQEDEMGLSVFRCDRIRMLRIETLDGTVLFDDLRSDIPGHCSGPFGQRMNDLLTLGAHACVLDET